MPPSAAPVRAPAGGRYDPGSGFYDEAFEAPARPRAPYRRLLASLPVERLQACAAGVASTLAVRGVRFGADEPFVVDPVPRIITAAEWAHLEAGLTQRLRALDRFVADVYGARRIVAAGVVPARALRGATHLEPALAGHELPGVWVGVAGLDVVRDRRGRWLVLEDNVRTPSGLAYMVAAREALDAQIPPAALPRRRSPQDGYALLARTLRAAAPAGRADPCAVVLTDGRASAAHFEHAEIARQLGVDLATPGQLETARGRLVLRRGRGRVPVDVLYRRTDEDRLCDGRGRPTGVGEMLWEPWRRGRLGLVNAFGTGIADDKLLHAHVEDMIRFYLGEEPRLRSVPTHDLGRADAREEALGRIHELVVKPRDGYGGRGIFVGAHATGADRRRMAAAVRARPDAYVAQETVGLSRHPTLVDGRLEPRHVDLRPFVYMTADGPAAAPGGLTRVALRPGSLVVNSSQRGGAKDTWVLR